MTNNKWKFAPLDDLGIEYDDEMVVNNPTELFKRAFSKGQELLAILNNTETMSDMQRKFTEKALKNKEAQERAREIIDELNNTLMGESAAVVANFISLLSSTTELANSIVRSMGIRESTPELPKATVHQQYMNLRKWFEMYEKMADPLFGMINNMPPTIKIPKLIAKPGSYVPKNGSIIYSYTVDGKEYPSPYSTAKILGIYEEGMMWLDYQNAILKGIAEGTYTNVQVEDISKK